MLRNGDVEGYLAAGGSLLAAVHQLAPTKDADRLRRICTDADFSGIEDEDMLELAGILRNAGIHDIAGRLYLRVYDDGDLPEESITWFADCAKKDRTLWRRRWRRRGSAALSMRRCCCC